MLTTKFQSNYNKIKKLQKKEYILKDKKNKILNSFLPENIYIYKKKKISK